MTEDDIIDVRDAPLDSGVADQARLNLVVSSISCMLRHPRRYSHAAFSTAPSGTMPSRT
jgi:hypothetical protein